MSPFAGYPEQERLEHTFLELFDAVVEVPFDEPRHDEYFRLEGRLYGELVRWYEAQGTATPLWDALVWAGSVTTALVPG